MRESDSYFGPDSVSWEVHKEVTVLFGGARALLLQAAHPLVIAGARETGFYERNPWKRLERTLRLTYALTFGPRAIADAAAERINEVHRRIHGVDEVTGEAYDALDPDLLLWVHACLVDSALLFEQRTVGKLDDAGRQAFHEEQMLAAEMLLLPRERIPATWQELRAYLNDVAAGGRLRIGDSALRLAEIFRNPPPEAEWRPVLRAVAWWAFGTLPPKTREDFGVRWNGGKEAALRANLGLVKLTRPLLPRKYRYIEPYTTWQDGHPYPETPGLLRTKGDTAAEPAP
jgi:uncharacterized protein (DUF2236 family)